MINALKEWFVYSLIGTGLGFILGYVLAFVWFFLGLLILGYRDSGPSWGNAITDLLFYAGLAIGVLAGQLFFFLRNRADTFKAKIMRRKRSP
jgi:putative flippase GtrA